MTKKVIAFDLDDTLAVSKSAVSDRMGELLVHLLDHVDICIISGGKIEQFMRQVVDRLEATDEQLGRLHLMPTCGTRYYLYDRNLDDWKLQYAEDLSVEEKQKIIKVTEKTAREAGLWPEKPYGEVIEDRESQISISFLGQEAPVVEKEKWAEKHSEERLEVRQKIAEQLLDYEIRAGGTTTIDITKLGIDKAYGMQKLMEKLSIGMQDILFVGDKLSEGGNDYPVKAMGIDTIAVERWEDTALVVEAIIKTA